MTVVGVAAVEKEFPGGPGEAEGSPRGGAGGGGGRREVRPSHGGGVEKEQVVEAHCVCVCVRALASLGGRRAKW